MATEHNALSLLILGVAGGAGQVYQGQCSSSFLLLRNGDPWCLVDLGLGVTRTLLEQGYALPDRVIITHNHSDHAGELPVVLRVESQRGRKLNIIAASPVIERLQQHRMAEHRQLLDITSLADWSAAEPEAAYALDAEFSLRFYPSRHSECCYGFVLYQHQQPLLGYSADSALCSSLYHHLSRCQYAIFDARPDGNNWHAGFSEVKPFLAKNRYIIGHGLGAEERQDDPALLIPGQSIALME